MRSLAAIPTALTVLTRNSTRHIAQSLRNCGTTSAAACPPRSNSSCSASSSSRARTVSPGSYIEISQSRWAAT
eukprot:scaffold129587_cov33-Tisochrysis_lutea.AAC.2